MTFEFDKEKKRTLRRFIKRMFTGKNFTKLIVILATLALILASILPYLL